MKIYLYTGGGRHSFYVAHKARVYHIPFGDNSLCVFPNDLLPSFLSQESTPLAFMVLTGFEIEKVMEDAEGIKSGAYKFLTRERKNEKDKQIR